MLEAVSANHYRVHGHIDMQESSALLRELMQLPSSLLSSKTLLPSKIDKQDLLLDVSSLESADSLLLAALLDLQRKLVLQSGRLKVIGLSESMQGLARVYGIETLLENMLGDMLDNQILEAAK